MTARENFRIHVNACWACDEATRGPTVVESNLCRFGAGLWASKDLDPVEPPTIASTTEQSSAAPQMLLAMERPGFTFCLECQALKESWHIHGDETEDLKWTELLALVRVLREVKP